MSNLPVTTTVADLVRFAKMRWRIEHDYLELKHGLGLDHFEGRTWRGWVTKSSTRYRTCCGAGTAPAPPAAAPFSPPQNRNLHEALLGRFLWIRTWLDHSERSVERRLRHFVQLKSVAGPGPGAAAGSVAPGSPPPVQFREAGQARSLSVPRAVRDIDRDGIPNEYYSFCSRRFDRGLEGVVRRMTVPDLMPSHLG
ncbi:hypothetical protein [Streptomyces sp. NPDC001401]|uniref:hypothetical protein n=1 Tax=Streptomyces sp. NPDC001401 TaxID=3364570 RepID=UPI003689BA4F